VRSAFGVASVLFGGRLGQPPREIVLLPSGGQTLPPYKDGAQIAKRQTHRSPVCSLATLS